MCFREENESKIRLKCSTFIGYEDLWGICLFTTSFDREFLHIACHAGSVVLPLWPEAVVGGNGQSAGMDLLEAPTKKTPSLLIHSLH